MPRSSPPAAASAGDRGRPRTPRPLPAPTSPGCRRRTSRLRPSRRASSRCGSGAKRASASSSRRRPPPVRAERVEHGHGGGHVDGVVRPRQPGPGEPQRRLAADQHARPPASSPTRIRLRPTPKASAPASAGLREGPDAGIGRVDEGPAGPGALPAPAPTRRSPHPSTRREQPQFVGVVPRDAAVPGQVVGEERGQDGDARREMSRRRLVARHLGHHERPGRGVRGQVGQEVEQRVPMLPAATTGTPSAPSRCAVSRATVDLPLLPVTAIVRAPCVGEEICVPVVTRTPRACSARTSGR